MLTGCTTWTAWRRWPPSSRGCPSRPPWQPTLGQAARPAAFRTWWPGTAIGRGTRPTWPARPKWSGKPAPGWFLRAWRKTRYISRISGGASLDYSMVRRAGPRGAGAGRAGAGRAGPGHSMVRPAGPADPRGPADRGVSADAAGEARLRGGTR